MTTSLNLSKKLAALNLGVDSEYVWRGKYTGSGSPQYPYQFLHEHYLGTYGKEEYQGNPKDNDYPAYTLPEILPVLKALGEKKGEKTVSETYEVIQGVEGKSLYKNDTRIIGSKPWGGGHSLVTFVTKVPFHEYHFLRIAELYAQSESLEGAEEYILKLIEE